MPDIQGRPFIILVEHDLQFLCQLAQQFAKAGILVYPVFDIDAIERQILPELANQGIRPDAIVMDGYDERRASYYQRVPMARLSMPVVTSNVTSAVRKWMADAGAVNCSERMETNFRVKEDAVRYVIEMIAANRVAIA